MADELKDARDAHRLTLGLTAKLIRERDDLRIKLSASEAEVGRLRQEVDAADTVIAQADRQVQLIAYDRARDAYRKLKAKERK